MEIKDNSYYLYRKQKKKRLLLKRIRFVCIVFAIIFIGIHFRNYVLKDESFPQAAALTGEMLEERASSISYEPTEGIEDLEKELEQYIKKFRGQYGIYYYNISTGDEFGINDEDEYTAASTIKIPLNLYLYKRVKDGAVKLDGNLTYLKEDYEEGTGIIRYEKFGEKYSVKELSRLSIVYSDNVAANMLFRFLGKANVKKYMRQVGGTVVDDVKNISCPKDMGKYMKLVYEFCQKEKTLGESLMDSLTHTEYNDRIPALLPKSVKVAHKIGNEVGVVNDAGIVFADTPYILCIMSKEANQSEADSVEANISKKIYDFVTHMDVLISR